MARTDQNGCSWSAVIYRLLLAFYPRPYLLQHRAEMLQNFHDFEQTSASKAELWLFLARDLAVSLWVQSNRSFVGQTTIVVSVLAVLLVYAEHHALACLRLTESCCFGYIPGWLAGWFGQRWQASSISRGGESYIRSLSAQATMVASLLVAVLAIAGIGSTSRNHVIWVLCYGFLLAWITGWMKSRRQSNR